MECWFETRLWTWGIRTIVIVLVLFGIGRILWDWLSTFFGNEIELGGGGGVRQAASDKSFGAFMKKNVIKLTMLVLVAIVAMRPGSTIVPIVDLLDGIGGAAEQGLGDT